MHATIESPVLARLCRLVSGVANPPKTGILPGASAVQIEVGPEALWLTTTDLEIAVKARGPITTGEPGRAAVPAHAFDTLVKTLPAGPVTLTYQRDKLTLQAGGTKAAWPTYLADDLPMPWGNPGAEAVEYEATLDQEVLLGVLKRTLHCVGKNAAIPAATGLNWQGSHERLRLTCLDGSRLAHVPLKVEGKGETSRTIPMEACRAIERVLRGLPGHARITVSDAAFLLDTGAIQVRTRVFDTKGFPDYSRMTRVGSAGAVITAGREALRVAVGRVKGLSEVVGLAPDDGVLKIWNVDRREGEIDDLVPATITSTEAQPSATVGATFLAEALDACEDDDVTLRWGGDGPSTPATGIPVVFVQDPAHPETIHAMAQRK